MKKKVEEKFQYFINDGDGLVLPLKDARIIRISVQGSLLLEEGHDLFSEELDDYRQEGRLKSGELIVQ